MSRKLHFSLLLGVLLSTTFATNTRVQAQSVSIVQTNGDQSLLLANEPSTSFGSSSGGTYTITINPSVTYQQMDGFGGSLTDSSTYNIYNFLTPAQQTAVLQSLFSSTSGIGLSMLRQPMGASDETAQGFFTYDDLPSGQTDVPLANFSIAKDLTYTIPVLKEAFAINPKIKVEMLPWSPPAWMKQSGTLIGGYFNDIYFPSLAQYFVKTIQAYQAEGIPVYAVAPQNEPDHETTDITYPAETFSASEEETFIANNLGPALANAGLSPKIFGYDHNWGDTTYPETLLAYGPAAAYLAGISWHCYSGAVTAQSTVEAAYPGFGVWESECAEGDEDTFTRDLQYTMENILIGSPNNWAKGATAWSLALDENNGPYDANCSDCIGFVTINTSVSPATVTKTPTYYAYGQMNGVVPGAYRVQSNSGAVGSGGIEDTAYLNPNGSMTLVVYNDATSSTTFDVNWAPNNTNFVYTLPANSAATFYWTPTTGVPLGIPTNLTATVASSSGINLNWTASNASGVTYDVFRSTFSAFAPTTGNRIASGLSATTFSDTGLYPGSTFHYEVEATNASGASNPSNEASATTTPVISTGSYYTIDNLASGLCLDDTNGSTSNGTVLQQYTCSQNDTNQQWQFTATAGGYYEITAYNASTLAWNVYDSGTSPGTNMQLWAYGGTNNEQFMPVLLSNGNYEFIDQNSGLCLNVPNGASTNSLQMQINTCNGSMSEAFTLTPPAASIVNTEYYTLTNEASGMCLDDTNGGISNGTVLQQYTCSSSGNTNQQWRFTPTSSGYYEIASYNSSTLAWNVYDSGTLPGTNMQLWTYSGGANEQFKPVLLATGYFEFIDQNSGLCLNVPSGAPTNSLQLQINTCNGSTSEAFKMKAAAPAISTTAKYQIANEASGMCADDTNGGISNGTVLQQYTCSSSANTNQQWQFTPTSGGYYEIASYNSSTLAWNVYDSGTAPGTNMQLWTYSGTNNEQFMPVLLSNGYYELIDKNSGLCLNVPYGAGLNSLQLQINSCNGGLSESFRLTQQ
ncbi:RICIN domain-containing protein [Tunturiibacter empetritectus]|uniref:Glucosylceramidase n=1 Tax=Tunturiibacter lichenicola TaxID=2051959 RepID=A0A852VIU8_9BACT|nr:RICIN domain-containing protein [Edaphobacter lichenicola]NYF91540.1 glucosylceramidase [Edaphobacter lichenicola]